jgi:hypothetical protein
VGLNRPLRAREPIAPLTIPLSLTAANFGKVPRLYIETLNDRGISTSLQRRMYSFLPRKKVLSMSTGHSPFLSTPRELTANLLSLART